MGQNAQTSDTPPSRAARNGANLRPWIGYSAVGVVLLAIALGAFFFLFVANQQSLQSQHLLRLLRTSGDDIARAIEARRANIERAAETRAHGEQTLEETIRRKLALIPGIDVPDDLITRDIPVDQFKTVEVSVHTDAAMRLLAFEVRGTFATPGAPAAGAVPGTGEPDVDAAQEAPAETATDETTTDETATDETATDETATDETPPDDPPPSETVKFRVTADLTELLAPWIALDGLIESTVVAKQSEEVFLHLGAQTVELLWLPEERRRAPNEEPAAPAASDPDAVGPEIREVEVAGRRYKLHIQPFRVPLTYGPGPGDDAPAPPTANGTASSVKETAWLIGALVPSDTFRARTMAVSPTFIIFTFAAIVVVLLCLPYLRIRFIGLREGLRARDVLLLVSTMFVACSLATVAVTHAATSLQERDVRRAELEQIAERIDARFQAELSAMHEVLTLRAEGALYTTQDAATEPDALAHSDMYPHFEILFGVDADGQQQWKKSIRESTTPLISLAHREYFRRARAGDLWPPPPGSTAAPRFVESIRSMTTGEIYGMLSTSDDTRRGTVAAIESELLSLIDPVLLPPYRFCVIDAAGRVQFHSFSTRNLNENLFDWLGSRWEIAAAVARGAPRHFDTTYRADPISAYLRPLEGTPWTLIVYADRRHLGYLDLETLTFSLGAYLLYIALLVAASGVTFLITSRIVTPPTGAARSMWYWPNPDWRPAYAILLFLVVVFIVIWGFGASQDPWPAWMPLYAFVAPTAALTLVAATVPFLARLVRWRGRPAKTTKKDRPDDARARRAESAARWPWAYVCVVVAVFNAFAVLPSLTFYGLIHQAESDLFERYRQASLAGALDDRIERHVARFEGVELSPRNERRIRTSLALDRHGNEMIHEALDVFLPNDWTASDTRAVAASNDDAAPRPGLFFRAVARLDELTEYPYSTTFGRRPPHPNYNEYASLSRELFGESVDPAGRLDWPAPGRLRVSDFRTSFVPLGRRDASDGPVDLARIDLTVETPHDYVTGANAVRSLPFAVGVVASISLLLGLLLWPLLRMVFVRRLKYPRAVDGRLVRPAPALQLRLRLPPTGMADGPVISVSIRQITAAASGDALVNDVEDALRGAGDDAGVLLAKFDYGLDDGDTRQKKLELLEYLISTKRPVTIKSSIDPLYFLTEQAHDEWDESRSDTPLGRWAAALQGFATLRTHEGFGQKERDDLRTALEAAPDQPTNPGAPAWSKIPRGVQRSLVAEGWFSQVLRDIATTLRNRPEIKGYSPEDVLEQFQDAAGAHYRRIWTSCSTNEKILLHRLASGTFANWKMQDTVMSLMRRRLIVAAPDFRLMNESFLQFVRRAEPPRVFARWERDAGPSTWTRIKVPVVVALLFVAAFFVVTQRDLFVQLLGIVTMLTASAPAFARLIGLVAHGRESGPGA